MLRAFQVPVGPRSHTGKLGCTATSARSTSETAIGPSTAPVAITLSRFDHAAWSKAASPDPLTPATMRRYLSGASLIQSCRSQVDWRNRVSRSPEARRLDCAQSRPPRAQGLEVRLVRVPGRGNQLVQERPMQVADYPAHVRMQSCSPSLPVGFQFARPRRNELSGSQSALFHRLRVSSLPPARFPYRSVQGGRGAHRVFQGCHVFQEPPRPNAFRHPGRRASAPRLGANPPSRGPRAPLPARRGRR